MHIVEGRGEIASEIYSETFYFVFFQRYIDLDLKVWRLKSRQSLIISVYLGKSNVDEVSRVYFIINYLSK